MALVHDSNHKIELGKFISSQACFLVVWVFYLFIWLCNAFGGIRFKGMCLRKSALGHINHLSHSFCPKPVQKVRYKEDQKLIITEKYSRIMWSQLKEILKLYLVRQECWKYGQKQEEKANLTHVGRKACTQSLRVRTAFKHQLRSESFSGLALSYPLGQW